jgi:hypothetical protein
LLDIGEVPIDYTKSYKKGDTFSYKSPFIMWADGHQGLFTYFVNLQGSTYKLGCFNFDFIPQKEVIIKE